VAGIPNEVIEQVAAANDIVEVVSSYIPLKRMGVMFKALCPFHNERTPSFTVNQQRQMFKCFGCGAGGSVIRFVMDYEKLEFPAAVRKLAERAGIQIPETQMSSEDYARLDLRRRLLALHAEATEFFHTQLMRGKSAGDARDYLKRRQLSAEVAKNWKIGYAPDSWDGLLRHAESAGYSEEELRKSGLFSGDEEGGRIFDRFRGRIMFPICNDTGEVIAFSGRVLFAEQSPAKYVNSPETQLFTKGAVLFGLHKSKRALIEKKQAIVCEGQIDLITAFENGVQNVIAPQGTAFTDRQARILKRYVDEVVLCFDSDAAGQKAAERSLPYLLGEGLLVRVAEMPEGEDPDSLIQKQGGAAFAAQIAKSRDFFEFQIELQSRQPDFNTPRGKVTSARKLADFISIIPDAVSREAVLNIAATRLEVGTQDLRAMLKKKPEFHRPENEEILDTPALEPIALNEGQQWLLLLALRDPASRMWLQAQGWERVLDDATPASALIAKVLDADFRAEETASVNAFTATLPANEEAALAPILNRPLPLEPRVIAEDCWHELERRDITKRRQAIEARLRSPGLTIEEQSRLHQQIIAIHQEAARIPPPRPPKLTM
jgi:DNA primase